MITQNDGHKQSLPPSNTVLAGRTTPMPVVNAHAVHGRPIAGDFSAYATLYVGMGCFWGAERAFWSLPGVYTTAVGYMGGQTPNPTYQEVCSGLTGHAECVIVIYDAAQLPFAELLRLFWERHDPTQGMRQGNDQGTQYRSFLACTRQEQYAAARASLAAYQQRLTAAGYGAITTEIVFPAPTFYYAETSHQQYLAKHPDGYCGLAGTGVQCPVE